MSPLLANIMLDELDKELEQRGHRFARYADDFVVLVKSPKAAERVMQATTRMLERRLKLRIFVRGWMNYYGLSQVYSDWPGLDTWLRRRLRMCYWVMWKRPRTRIRNLLALDVRIRQAVGLGRSSLGPWKCARLLGFAMSKNWLESQGLICLADEWWRCASLR